MADTPIPTPPRQTSRGQVSRIDRSYFQRPNRLQIARRWLVVACLVAGAGWAAWGAFDQSLHYAPGPVAAVHAKWEQDCQACHVPFAPIKDDTFLSTAATRHEIDLKCESCHRGEAHHPLQVSAEVGSCASCHADHRGRQADLSRVADRTCTACHAEIAAHRIADAAVPHSTVDMPITRFDDEHHPAFAGLASDPGRLKFSHGRHMRAGLTFGPAGVWNYAMLAAEDRQRYQPEGVDAAAPVQLACASCHEFGPSLPPDAVRTVSAALAAAPAGAYALPVEFGRHCAACHTLPYEGLPGPRDAATPSADIVLPAVAEATADPAALTPVAGRVDRMLQHGLDTAGIVAFLEARFLREALAADPTLFTEPPPPRRPLPHGEPAGDDATSHVRSLVAKRVREGLSFARGTCEKCHEVQGTQLPGDANLLAAWNVGALGGFEVAATQVPDIWLKKSRFDHRPHRAYDCRECHAAAYPDEPATGAPGDTGVTGSPLDNGLVMIAGLESCKACHAPAARDHATGRTVGGARFDCVECHGYHGLGPHAQAPVAATALNPQGAASHDRSE